MDDQTDQTADGLLHAWVEWKERCARGLCSPTTQTILADFAGRHFDTYVGRYIARTGVDSAWRIVSLFPPADAWHLFETHLCARKSLGGKHYKDWLFARSPEDPHADLQAIEAGASVIMRDVVRRQLRADYAPVSCISIDLDIFDKQREISTAPTVFLARPDPLDETMAHETEDLARKHAIEAFETMTDRERMTLFCREEGLPLSHPAVTRAAGCRKSVLHDTYRAFFVRIARWIQNTYPDDDTESVLALTLMLIHGIKARIREWAEQDACCRELLELLESP